MAQEDHAQETNQVAGAQYPMDGQIPQVGQRETVASGYRGVYQSMRFAVKEGPIRSVRSLAVVNKKGGFDCPSCAWPDPDDRRHPAEFCENGAKAVAWEATNKRLTPEFFASHSIAELAAKSEQWLGDQGRIVQPMVLRPGSEHYEPIDWEDAFELIAGTLRGLASPDEALFYTSGRASNEAAFVYQLFARQFGTNNLPDCSNMCHESSGLGLNQSIGIGKGTVKLSDFDQADSIFIIGQNPGTNHPRMLTALEEAVKNGCRIVSLNPMLETGMMRFRHPQSPRDMLGPGTRIACLSLPVRINGDVAALKGIMKGMLQMDEASGGTVLDRAFIEQKTHGFEAFAADIAATEWEEIERESGLGRGLLLEAAQIAAKSQRMITCWAMGITQHRNGVANVQTIVNFNLLRGQIGRPGAGVCPVRGHSNVQGDRTVGIWEKMPESFMAALGKEFNFTPPQKHGYDTVGGARAMAEGKVKVFVGLGGNFFSAGPDTQLLARGFRRTALSVQISTKLNRNHLITGRTALILPCLGRTERDVQASGEQFVSCENSMGVVQQSRGRLKPAGEQLLSETAIICRLAAATLQGRTTVDWLGLCANYDRIRDHIERVVPGFENYNVRVREPGGFYLPNPPRDRQAFHTATGRANFVVHPIPRLELKPQELLMMSVRSHDQFNTTIYGPDDRYRGIYGGRHVIFMNPQDIAGRGLQAGQWVDVSSASDGQKRTIRGFKVVAYDLPRCCCAMYFPECNPLVALGSVAAGSNQPASKSVVVTVRAAEDSPTSRHRGTEGTEKKQL